MQLSIIRNFNLSITEPTRTDLNFLAAEAAIKGSGMSFGSAGILSGQHEGLSAWLSANYLLDKLPRDHVRSKLSHNQFVAYSDLAQQVDP